MEKTKTSGLGIASFILGLIGIAIIWIPLVSIVGLILGILALIFGAYAFWGKAKSKFGLTGFILGLIAVVLAIVVTALSFYFIAGTMTPSSYEMPPTISSSSDWDEKTIIIISIDPDDVLWSDIKITGTCDYSHLSGYIKEGDTINECYGSVTLNHKPSGAVLNRFTFPE